MFHEVRFPLSVGAGCTFGPSYSTDVVSLPNGAEQRNINWTYPRCKGNVSLGIREEADFKELLTFFHNRCGKAYGFRFFDYFDHDGDREYLGMGNGTNKVYQLRKNYVDEVLLIARQRKIVKPIDGTIRVFVLALDEGVEFSWGRQLTARANEEGTELSATAYSVDTTTGIVTLNTAPPDGTAVLATFQFDVPVRFDTDEMTASWELVQAAGWTDIPLIELKY